MGVIVDDVAPFVGMVSVQLIQVLLMVAIKEATSAGMTKFTFVFYSNALAAFILLPISLFTHRTNRPPITLSLLCKFFLLGFLGWIAQITGNVAIQITPASFVSALLNLIPGFTFVLAVIFRMEVVDFMTASTLAKAIGTIVSILGALVATLYKGPTILSTTSLTNTVEQILTIDNNYVKGGLLLIVDCFAASAFTITQTLVLKEFSAELIIVFFYCFFVVILTAVYSLLVSRDPLAAWSLQPPVRLLAILYSGIIGSATQVSISTWCVRKKGPVFVAIFHPFGIVIAVFVGMIFLNDILYTGSLVGSVIIVVGFYSVMWGKAKEQKLIKDDSSSLASPNEEAPLLQNVVGKDTHV